jgi:aminoglycoside phosphotransferase (APT) family kinase protein
LSVDELVTLRAACAAVGLSSTDAEPVRSGENAIYRLPDRVIVRIARLGQLAAAQREVEVASWLAHCRVPAVRVLDVEQPVEINGHGVTFWHELPAHRNGTPIEIADALRRLHGLPLPNDIALPSLSPFVRLADRIAGAVTLREQDRLGLSRHLADLERRYQDLVPTRPHCVVHGDAWAGNVVATVEGDVVLLDLERCSIGPPEWDLVSTAIKVTSLASVSANDYRDFCDRYGYDVTTWAGYEVLRDIRELRMCSYVAQLAVDDESARVEAEHRVRCLRGDKGPRPWRWTAF